jgi:NTE family protein
MQTQPTKQPERGRPARVGLVLGAGGAAGLAFHAGVLWALHHDLGWDARTADIIVGTSAGSVVGSLLRSDVPPEDMAAWTTRAGPSREGNRFRAVMEAVEVAETRPTVPTLTVPGWHTLNLWRHPSQIPRALTTLLPHGLLDHTPKVATLERLVDTWPAKPLWISALRVGDGRLEWFGRDLEIARRISPADAIAASCAIPVLARPVRIGGHRYVDGGVKSPTNADVLVGADLDLVVVLSPMGHRAGRNPLRALAHRQARHEVARLVEAGVAVQLISPDVGTVHAMGLNMLDDARTGAVMRHAFMGTAAQVDEATQVLLRGIGVDSVA